MGRDSRHDVLVLGAGIVGLSVALHLQSRGRDVVLVDRAAPGHGASFGNAGLIERASLVPYAFPRDLASIVRHALNRGSAVRHDPRHLPRALPWLLRYWWHSAPSRLARAAADLGPLIERSVEEHRALAELVGADALLRPTGYVEVFRDAARRDRAFRAAEALAAEHTLSVDALDPAALGALEGAVRDGVLGALHWRDPWTVSDPGALCAAYAARFTAQGGRLARGDARTLEADAADGWRVTLADGRTRGREAVIALGAGSAGPLRTLDYRLPLGVKRGYHMHYAAGDATSERALGRPLVDEDGGFVLAPMRRGIRLSTGVELAASDAPPSGTQLARAEHVARGIVALGARLDEKPWLGLRPCLPDMRPVIGPAPRHRRLWFAFGHAHHGLTLGPLTGRLLAELIGGEDPCVDPAPFAPTRFASFGRRGT